MEDLSDMTGSTPIEAKCELIQVALEMLGSNLSLMGCDKPSFEQRGYKVDMREDLDGKLAISPGVSNPVLESRLWQTFVTVPAVGMNPRSPLHDIGDKADQAISRPSNSTAIMTKALPRNSRPWTPSSAPPM